MPYLQLLDLSRNHLSGIIPSDIGNATSLKIFDISFNHLEGELPAALSSLVNIVVLDLSGNKFTGAIPNIDIRQLPVLKVIENSSFLGESFSVFCQLTLLRILDLSNNQLFGELPGCFWNLKDLQSLDLSSNAFAGEVPTSTYYNSSLRSLDLSNNKFTGCFPAVMKNYKSLVVLDLGNNKLSGIIPLWIGERIPLLRILRLRSNMFYGSIPWQLSQLSHLQLLDLAENSFVDSIPESFANFFLMKQTSTMQPLIAINIQFTTFIISQNSGINIVWKGREYTFWGRNAFVTGIDLSGNSLSGEIPLELTNLRGIQFLNMSRNYLSGGIPKDIGNLKLLESLDLSWNKLSGHIPPSISNLMFLDTLNLSNNHLSGEIPTGSQLQTINDPSIYSNNVRLCGPPLSTACTNNSSTTTALDGEKEDHHELETLWLYYSVIAGTVFGFWVWFGALIFCKIWRFALFSCIDALHQKFMHKMKST